MKQFKKSIAVFLAIMMAGSAVGLTGCMKKGDKGNTEEGDADAAEEYSMSDVKGWCSDVGSQYMSSALTFDFNAMMECSDYETNGGVEDALFNYFDDVTADEWLYEFYYETLGEATYNTSNFEYDLDAGTASMDYRIAIDDYSSDNPNAVIRYIITLDFLLDTENESAVIANPSVIIAGFYQEACDDYNRYLLRELDATSYVESQRADETEATEETEPVETAAPTPTPEPTPTPTPTPTPEPEPEETAPEETEPAETEAAEEA